MSSDAKHVNSKKDAFLISQFCKSENGSQRHSHSHSHSRNHQQFDGRGTGIPDLHPIDTLEADIGTILDQPLSERADFFYDDYRSGQSTATLESTKPWTKDPNYFQNVHVSSLALLKMTIHARSGGSIEIMGMLTGKIVKNGIVVMDVYPLPVEGTETRVNAQSEGYEFMVQYLESLKKTGRYENIVGWYHSHPGYGCWLSGIDVSTQSLNQTFQDPYLAIVVDPERTISQGTVEIGAFRTYSDEYVKKNNKLTNNSVLGSASLGLSPVVQKGTTIKKATNKTVDKIPEEKAKDFGLHASKYYSLSIDIFRSNMDHLILQNLWNKYWISNLLDESATNDSDGDKSTDKHEQALKKLERLSSRLTSLKKTELKQEIPQRPTRKSKLISLPSTSNTSKWSPFTKAHIMSKMKGKGISDSDASDSEMNDVDSDTDSRQDEDEDERKVFSSYSRENPFNAGFDMRRKIKYNSAETTRDLAALRFDQKDLGSTKDETKDGSSDSNDKFTDKGANPFTTEAAEAGRSLMSLKIQQILFLNE